MQHLQQNCLQYRRSSTAQRFWLLACMLLTDYSLEKWMKVQLGYSEIGITEVNTESLQEVTLLRKQPGALKPYLGTQINGHFYFFLGSAPSSNIDSQVPNRSEIQNTPDCSNCRPKKISASSMTAPWKIWPCILVPKWELSFSEKNLALHIQESSFPMTTEYVYFLKSEQNHYFKSSFWLLMPAVKNQLTNFAVLWCCSIMLISPTIQ